MEIVSSILRSFVIYLIIFSPLTENPAEPREMSGPFLPYFEEKHLEDSRSGRCFARFLQTRADAAVLSRGADGGGGGGVEVNIQMLKQIVVCLRYELALCIFLR